MSPGPGLVVEPLLLFIKISHFRCVGHMITRPSGRLVKHVLLGGDPEQREVANYMHRYV